MKKRVVILTFLGLLLAGPISMSQETDRMLSLEAAVAEAESSGNDYTLVHSLAEYGNALFDAGDDEKALECCCRAFSLLADEPDVTMIGSCTTISNSLFTIARIYRKNNEPDRALTYYQRTLDLEKALNRLSVVNLRYDEIISLLIEDGRYNEALDYISVAKTYTDKTKNMHFVGRLYYHQGVCEEALGKIAEASDSYNMAIESAKSLNVGIDHVYLPLYLERSASVALERGDTVLARVQLDSAHHFMQEHDHFAYSRQIFTGLADMFGDFDPELSEIYAAKAKDFDFVPALDDLASKIALRYIDFPAREREQKIRNERLTSITMASLAALLLAILIIVLYRNYNLKRLSEYRKQQNESLQESLQKKNKLLEIANSIADEKVSREVISIADEMGPSTYLTKREMEIAVMIANGLLNKEIAYKLNISVRTVENHRNSIYKKLGVNNSVEMVNCIKTFAQADNGK